MTARALFPAVLFDLDGTLVDSLEVDNLAFQRAILETVGQDIPVHALNPYLGMPAPAIFARFVEPQQVEPAHAAWLRHKVMLEDGLVLYPGICEVLEALHHAGTRMGVVTSQTSQELEHMRTLLKLDQLIDVWVPSDLVSAHKPDPAQLNYALRALNIDAARAVMVGDTARDMEAGRRAGTAIGAAVWGWGLPETLLAFHPEFVFETAEDIYSLIVVDPHS